MAIFSTIGSIINTKSNNKAAAKAGDIAQQNNAENNALAREIYGQNQANLAPYMNAGTQPLSLMQGAMGYGDQTGYQNAFRNFIQNSDYGFQFGEGSNAINSGYAGAGTLQSGAAMRGIEDYRQNLQSGYRGEFNNMLANQQSLGLAGASAVAGVGQNYQNTVTGNNNLGSTNAANAILSRQSAAGNALGTIGGAAQSFLPTLGKLF
jgi:hypothetical protein